MFNGAPCSLGVSDHARAVFRCITNSRVSATAPLPPSLPPTVPPPLQSPPVSIRRTDTVPPPRRTPATLHPRFTPYHTHTHKPRSPPPPPPFLIDLPSPQRFSTNTLSCLIFTPFRDPPYRRVHTHFVILPFPLAIPDTSRWSPACDVSEACFLLAYKQPYTPFVRRHYLSTRAFTVLLLSCPSSIHSVTSCTTTTTTTTTRFRLRPP